jgi:transcriptional regulator with XRE-family HTH domain
MHPLRAHREANQLSLKDVAVTADTTVATVCRIERGTRSPSFALADRLSRATGLPLEDFLPRASAASEAAE